jgi:hypothetical protein
MLEQTPPAECRRRFNTLLALLERHPDPSSALNYYRIWDTTSTCDHVYDFEHVRAWNTHCVGAAQMQRILNFQETKADVNLALFHARANKHVARDRLLRALSWREAARYWVLVRTRFINE